MTEPTPPDQPPGSPREGQLVVLFVFGPLLAIGGCAIAALSPGFGLLIPLGVVFVLGVALTISGIVVVFMKTIDTWKEIIVMTFVIAALIAMIILGMLQ